MRPLTTDHQTFLDLPFEIRLQIYENALQAETEILACSCAADIKTQPFLGHCTTALDIRRFILDMPYAIKSNKQMYQESQSLTKLNKHCEPALVVGGTKCFSTLLKCLPRQHPQNIKVIMRLTVRTSWSHKTNDPISTLVSFDSLVASLGIGTGKAYTVSTKEVRVLPDFVGDGLELLQAEVHLSMRCESKGWLAFERQGSWDCRDLSSK
jgi:hypothetical protein